MAQNNDVVFDAEFWGYKEFCDNLTCPSHQSGFPVYYYPKDSLRFYLLDQRELNEFWKCCVRDQEIFCEKKCDRCNVCKYVSVVYEELKQNYFFDFDKSSDRQPVLWKVFSINLDKKLMPVLAEIEIAKTVCWV